MEEATCPKCGEEMKDGKCRECGAWTDSYGLIHAECCEGGFHEGECPCEENGGKKRKGRGKRR